MIRSSSSTGLLNACYTLILRSTLSSTMTVVSALKVNKSPVILTMIPTITGWLKQRNPYRSQVVVALSGITMWSDWGILRRTPIYLRTTLRRLPWRPTKNLLPGPSDPKVPVDTMKPTSSSSLTMHMTESSGRQSLVTFNSDTVWRGYRCGHVVYPCYPIGDLDSRKLTDTSFILTRRYSGLPIALCEIVSDSCALLSMRCPSHFGDVLTSHLSDDLIYPQTVPMKIRGEQYQWTSRSVNALSSKNFSNSS